MKKIILSSALTIASTVAIASNSLDDLATVQKLYAQGMAGDAYKAIMLKHDPLDATAQEWLLMGLVANADKRPREAKGYFEKVAQVGNPAEVGRAKLEIARITYALGDVDGAKAHFQEVKASNPPKQVGDNIDQFISQMDANGAPRTWSAFGSIGYMDDSNPRASTSANSVLMFGLPFTLSQDAQKVRDQATLWNIGVNHTMGMTDTTSWLSTVSMNGTKYQNIKTVDTLGLSVSSGPSVRVLDDVYVSAPLVVDWLQLGHDKPYYYYSYGIAPQVRFSIFSPATQLNIASTMSHRKFNDLSDKDSDNYSVAPSLIHQFSQTQQARIGLVFGQENAVNGIYSNTSTGVNVSYSQVFGEGWQATASALYSEAQYQDKEAAYDDKRRDKLSRFSLDVTYRIKAIDSNLVFSIARTENNSNLDIYKYDRDQVTIALQKSF